MPKIRRFVVCFPIRLPVFDSKSSNVGFVMENVALERVFL
jgi:hypothetical protein